MNEQMTNDTPVDNQPDAASANDNGENTQVVGNVKSTEIEDQTDPNSSESDTDDTLDQGNESVDNNMSADMTDREKSAVRKMHEATQETAKYKKDSEAFQELLNHPEFNEFITWQKNKQNPSQSQNEFSQAELTEDDLIALQSDPAKYRENINNQVQSIVNPIAKQAMEKINNLERKLAVSQHEREIDAVAAKHPDFWDVDPRIMKAAIGETQGQGAEAAYTLAKQLEKQYVDKANTSIQKKVQAKKKASSNTPRKSIEPSIIYVKNKAEQDKVSFQQASLGKRVDVRIKE